jgi:hypothetical protein
MDDFDASPNQLSILSPSAAHLNMRQTNQAQRLQEKRLPGRPAIFGKTI